MTALLAVHCSEAAPSSFEMVVSFSAPSSAWGISILVAAIFLTVPQKHLCGLR